MGLLDGLSPWWWIALAILLAAAEMLTVTTVLMSAAVAAVATALCLWIVPDLSGAIQIATFGLLTIVFTFAGRALVGRFGDGAAETGTLNRRAAQLVGREAVVTEFNQGQGQVMLDGVPWPARIEGPLPEPGEQVRIVATDGIILRVERLTPITGDS